MADASTSVDQEQFICPVCLEPLKDPVSLHCEHSFCKVCINGCWDQEDQRRVYNCPQCRQTFTPRPDLHRNNMLADVVENPKKTELQAGAADVECDVCAERKHKAIKSCLTCLASFCETHIGPHYQSPACKKPKLVDVSSKVKEKICAQHDQRVEIFCRTDQLCICNVCVMDEHKGHNTVSASAERADKQSELKEQQRKLQQRLQEKLREMEEVKQTVETIKTAVEDIEKKRSEVRKLIRDQEKDEVSRAEGVLERLEQEIADLKRRDAELEQLSHTEDHIHFLQNFQTSGSEDSSSTSVHQHPSFDEVMKSLSELKERLEELCRDEFNKIPPHAELGDIILPSEPKNREEFLKCFCHLTLDPNTAYRYLRLSEKNRVVTDSMTVQNYADRPERFDQYPQVLCEESLCGRCYWEVEWSSRQKWGGVSISVTYKGMGTKGGGDECVFGFNNHSWRLCCSDTLSFCHNSIKTELSESPSSRIGVYVDHSAGTLSFYRVSDTMSLLHRVHTTFTQPLYTGFGLIPGSAVRLCDPK